MKKLIVLAFSALLCVSLSAQENGGLGQKYGNYEIKIGKGKYTSNAPVTAIWDNATKVWVTSPTVDKKNHTLFFLPPTEVTFIQGEDYVPEAQGLVSVYFGYTYGKGIEYPKNNWLCKGHCGIFRIENDKLVPIVESGGLLEKAYLWEARYAFFKVVPNHQLIIGSFHPDDKKGYSVFNLQGERLYNDLKDFKYKDEPSISIQLEDGSWHHLDPTDGGMID